jgi:hypothetical protein
MNKDVMVWEYPDGRIEVHGAKNVLPYSRYDKLPQIDQGAIVENKQLGQALRLAQILQAQRDDRRSTAAPSRTHRTLEPVARKALQGKKSVKKITQEDLNQALKKMSAAH